MKRVEKERTETKMKGGYHNKHGYLFSEGREEYWKRDREHLAPYRAEFLLFNHFVPKVPQKRLGISLTLCEKSNILYS